MKKGDFVEINHRGINRYRIQRNMTKPVTMEELEKALNGITNDEKIAIIRFLTTLAKSAMKAEPEKTEEKQKEKENVNNRNQAQYKSLVIDIDDYSNDMDEIVSLMKAISTAVLEGPNKMEEYKGAISKMENIMIDKARELHRIVKEYKNW